MSRLTAAIFPLFMLIFFIICFVVIIWIKKRPDVKPIVRQKEGFQISPSATHIRSPVDIRGSDIGSTERLTHSIYDNNPITYTRFSKTAIDSYYDTYENNELQAMSNIVDSLGAFVPPKNTTTAGQALDQCDVNAPVPWDSDNSSLDPSQVLWGVVSPQASLSLNMKNYIQCILSNVESIIPCSDDITKGFGNFCYYSPLFHVDLHDPVSATAVQFIDQGLITGGGQMALMNKVQENLEKLKERYPPIVKPSFDAGVNRVIGGLTRLGDRMLTAGGEKKVKGLMAERVERIKLKLNADIEFERILAPARVAEGMATVEAIAAPEEAVAIATMPFGAALLIIVRFFVEAVEFILVSLPMLLMCLQSIIDPIMQSLFKMGGTCPAGSKPFFDGMDVIVKTTLTTIVPFMAQFESLDPYICWKGLDPVLREWPRKSPFMTDRSLSLVYHADWMAAESEVHPPAGIDTPVCDIIEPGYVRRSTQPEFQGKFNEASDMAVKICSSDTTPSPDGLFCNQLQYKTDVVSPIFSPCAADQYDDGSNCWPSSAAISNCSGGTITRTQSTIWDATTGYERLTMTPLTCPGMPAGAVLTPITAYINRISCPSGYKFGNTTTQSNNMLCYKDCNTGYSLNGSACLGSRSTYQRDTKPILCSMVGERQTFNPLMNLSDVNFPYCDFSDPVMLDRMAQFYYNNSRNNPKINTDASGNITVTVQVITKFYGVTASSELSCDVVCDIEFITYDPITGSNYSVTLGCSYPDDPTWRYCIYCFRRFYFIKGDSDPQGIFTVTGCTFADYTAPDAMVQTDASSGDNFVTALLPPSTTFLSKPRNTLNPTKASTKVFQVTDRESSILDVSRLRDSFMNGTLITEIAISVASTGLQFALPQSWGFVTQVVVGGAISAAQGMEQMYLQPMLEEALRHATPPEEIHGIVTTTVVGTSTRDLSIMSSDDYWTVYHGPIYEIAAGYTPNLNFCENAMISNDYCAHKYVLRDVINKYHTQYPTTHIKEVTGIEARGNNGCYYKWNEVVYNTATNIEGTIREEKEIILTHDIQDYTTCTYYPLSFTNANDPVYNTRSYIDGTTKKVIYPTRSKVFKSDLVARYVRIRPAVNASNTQVGNAYVDPVLYEVHGNTGNTTFNGDGFMNLTQLEVYDVSGYNISKNKRTYATSTAVGSGSSDIVVNGITSPGAQVSEFWQQATASRTTEYWEVDLGKNTNIAEVVYFGALTIPPVLGRNIGVRIQFLYSNTTNETPVLEYVIPNDDTVQVIPLYVSFTTKPTVPIAGPIQIPSPESTEQHLGDFNCVDKCTDATLINNLVTQYNSNPSIVGAQIMKVTKGTPSGNLSCEYEVEMNVTTTSTPASGSGSSTTINTLQRQYINMNLSSISSGSSGPVRGRFIRVLPNSSSINVLEISHLVVVIVNPQNGQQYNVSSGKPITCFNELYLFDEANNAAGSNRVNGGQCVRSVVDGMPAASGSTSTGRTFQPEVFPNLFVAATNDFDVETFFEIDLLTDYQLYSMQFYGRNDTERYPGGIKGITIEVYADKPTDEDNATNGTYPPIYTYTLQTDDTIQNIIFLPRNCAFGLQSTDILSKPAYLTPSIPPISSTDNSGGLFTFSGILSSLKNTWNTILPLPLQSQDLLTTSLNKLQQNDNVMHNILDNLGQTLTIAGTTKKCNDPDVLKNIMMYYNNNDNNVPKQYQGLPSNATSTMAQGSENEYGIVKNTMLRILKAGQSTPNTCDILYEQSYEVYDDYMVDITDANNRGKEIKASRFIMSGITPSTDPALIGQMVDISANALGIISDTTTVSPPFSSASLGPACSVNCRSPDIIASIKGIVNNNKYSSSDTTGPYTETYTLKSITNSFQPSPFVCEYTIVKDGVQKYSISNQTYPDPGIVSYIKAVFSMGVAPSCTHTTVSINEYDPALVTWSPPNDPITNQPANFPIKYKGVNTVMPYIFFYDTATATSTRVNSQIQNI